MNVNKSLFVVVGCQNCRTEYVLWKGVSLEEITDWMSKNTTCRPAGRCKLGRVVLD